MHPRGFRDIQRSLKGKEVSENSNAPGRRNNMPEHIRETVQDIEKQIEFDHTKCTVLAEAANAIEERLENKRMVADQLKRECQQRVKELKDEYEQKVMELRKEYDDEDRRRKELLKDFNTLQHAQEEKRKMIKTLTKEYHHA